MTVLGEELPKAPAIDHPQALQGRISEERLDLGRLSIPDLPIEDRRELGLPPPVPHRLGQEPIQGPAQDRLGPVPPPPLLLGNGQEELDESPVEEGVAELDRKRRG